MITIFTGPMFAGKTSMLVKTYKQFRIIGKRVCLIKSMIDTRGHISNIIITHNDEAIEADIVTKNLNDVDVSQYDYIFIDEGQFFDDIELFCLRYYEKHIFIAALDLDCKQVKFESMGDLFNISIVIKFKSTCDKCGMKNGEFTIRNKMSLDEPLIQIGGHDLYSVICIDCLNLHN